MDLNLQPPATDSCVVAHVERPVKDEVGRLPLVIETRVAALDRRDKEIKGRDGASTGASVYLQA